MKRSGTRRPWSQIIILNRARKARNINGNYSALSELHGHCAHLPGATRLTLFGACPWLSYSAPLALNPALIFRAFGASLASFFAKPPNRRKGEYSELMLSPFLICLTLITGALAQDNQSPKPTATIMVTGRAVYEDAGQPATRHRVQLIASESLLNSRSCLRQRV